MSRLSKHESLCGRVARGCDSPGRPDLAVLARTMSGTICSWETGDRITPEPAARTSRMTLLWLKDAAVCRRGADRRGWSAGRSPLARRQLTPAPPSARKRGLGNDAHDAGRPTARPVARADERVPRLVRADTRFPNSAQLSTRGGGAAPFVPEQARASRHVSLLVCLHEGPWAVLAGSVRRRSPLTWLTRSSC